MIMRLAVVTTLLLGLAATCPQSLAAQQFNFIYPEVTGSTGIGFDDPTLGTARRTAWEFAVTQWGARVNNTQTINVESFWDNLGTGSSVTLGRASSVLVFRDFTGAPQAGTFYPSGLANEFFGSDINTGSPEIRAEFNHQVDTLNALGSTVFYYGLDENPPAGTISFVRTALHELCHGFGFSAGINSSGELLGGGFPTAFDRFLVLDATAQTPLTTMNDAGRASAIRSDNLYWSGATVTAANSGNLARMHAPATYVSGSSVSHFKLGHYSPPQLMEPSLSGASFDPGLSDELLFDLGWSMNLPSSVRSWTQY